MGVVAHNACSPYWFHAARCFSHFGGQGAEIPMEIGWTAESWYWRLSLSKNRSSFLLITAARTIPEKVFEKEAAN
jgi:hypothetical protein